MKKLLGSVAMVALFSGSAVAADLPARGPAIAPAPVYMAPIFTWSGFYVGANLGVAFNNRDDRRVEAIALDGATVQEDLFVGDFNAAAALVDNDRNRTSLTGGVQLGYNWQFGAMVFGIEGDINFRGRDRTRGFDVLGAGFIADTTDPGLDGLPGTLDDVVIPGSDGFDVTVRSGRDSKWFATIRPRLGFAMDRTLLYITGGLAYAKSSSGTTIEVINNDTLDVTTFRSRSGSNWGWTLGGGIEHAFSNNWSLKLEYLYVDLDRDSGRTVVATGPDLTNVTFRGLNREDNFHVVRAGINYRFGGPAAGVTGPVVARY